MSRLVFSSLYCEKPLYSFNDYYECLFDKKFDRDWGEEDDDDWEDDDESSEFCD